jgi:hypothetical protein
MIQIREETRLENPRAYDPSVVARLRGLLSGGVSAQPDRRRNHFYEIDVDNETYYIHISPVNGDVVLLARWLRQPQDCCLGSAHLAV